MKTARNRLSLFIGSWNCWTIFPFLFLIHLGSLLFFQAAQVQKEAERISLLVDLHAKGQGVVIGTTGFVSLFSSLLEADGKLCVTNIQSRQGNKVYLERSFQTPETFSIADTLDAATTFGVQLSGYEVSGKVYPSNYLVLTLSLIALVSSCSILASYFFFKKIIESKSETQTVRARAELAHQVAHDIRSPLIALEILLEENLNLPKDQLILVRSATTRIKDIANELISREFLRKDADQSKMKPAPQLMALLIDSILTEKRIQYKGCSGLNLNSTHDLSSAFSFAEVNPIEFKRVISNLINNSVEAMDGGHVDVTSTAKENHLYVTISDNGRGIPKCALSELGKKGYSYGKSGSGAGSGLGLYHAKQAVLAWGGDLEIKSEIGIGTKVTIKLPLSREPSWLCGNITIQKGSRVIIVDDENSASLAWKHLLQNSDFELIPFSNANSFREWFQQQTTVEDDLFIFDYDLNETLGTQLIKEFSLEKASLLATSKFNDPVVLEEVTALGIRLIPKEMIRFLQIRISGISPYESDRTVLLDDEISNQLAWKLAAKKVGVRLECFGTSQELFNNLSEISLNSTFYIDFSLGEALPNGLEVIQQLHNRGYRNLYLSTGYEKESFSNVHFLCGTIGKMPPWSSLNKI
jgi:signal transduction histidine kinase